MSDLYHIPHDDGKTYRLKKFVEYQHEVPSIHYRFAGEYCKKYRLSPENMIDVAFLLSVTYSEVSAIFIYNQMKSNSIEQIWDLKGTINFGSAKKHTKNNNEFVPVMHVWFDCRDRADKYVYNNISNSPQESYLKVHRTISSIQGFGRFSADIFLETLVYLQKDLGIFLEEPLRLDWKNCANLTSGIFNIFYEDEKANEFDKTKSLTDRDKQYLTAKLRIIQASIRETYPEQDSQISMFIGKICSFRNLFKNARYAGFHHDRELGVIKEYQKNYPQLETLWQQMLELRRDIFPHKFLGELNGWTGIRKERKKIWLSTGMTGAE